MKKASKRRILFAARMATMVGAACFAASGISETLGQEKEKKPAGLHNHRGNGRDDVYAGGRRDNATNGDSKGS